MTKRGFGVRLPGLKSLAGHPELITTLGFGSCLHNEQNDNYLRGLCRRRFVKHF